MSALREFFHGSETRLGVFYPTHYLVAVFENPRLAARAVGELRHAGFAETEVIATDGQALLDLEKEDSGPVSTLMQSFSRFFREEQVFVDHDLDHARRGAGFVAAYCANEEEKNNAWRILQMHHALYARYYGALAVEQMTRGVKTH